MARENIQVPFGYEPPDPRDSARGSIWVYDHFEDYTEQELVHVLNLADQRSIAKVVFYPLHEETIRRMEKRTATPYYRRVDELQRMLEDARTTVRYVIESFEGKRKKYTPMDTAFRFLDEKYASPHFVYVTAATANLLAGYDTFEQWIKRLRLFIAGNREDKLHPRLLAHANRWELV